MKKNIGSTLLLLVALGGLAWSIYNTPPGGAPWSVFAGEPASVGRKISFLMATYLWPGFMACCAISIFQLQFRLAGSGANKRMVFAGCMLASGCMLLSLRTLALSPAAGPSYVAGMATGYTVMSRLYAVRMRAVWRGVRLPWPVWRGNAGAMREIDDAVRRRISPPQN